MSIFLGNNRSQFRFVSRLRAPRELAGTTVLGVLTTLVCATLSHAGTSSPTPTSTSDAMQDEWSGSQAFQGNATTQSGAEITSPHDCDATCATNDASMDQAALLMSACGTEETNEDYANCATAWTTYNSQINEYCQVIRLANTGVTANTALATAYTAVAISCLSACVCESGPQSIFCIEILKPVCIAGGVLTGAADAGASIGIALDNENYTKKYPADMIGAIVTGVGGAATGVTTGIAGGASSCYASGIYGAIATVKFLGIFGMENSAKQACAAIKDRESLMPDTYGGTIDTPSITSGPGGAGASGARGKAGKTSTAGTGTAEAIKSMESDFPGAVVAASTDGKNVFDKFDNKSKIPEGLKELGTDLNQIASAIQNGKSPTSIIGGLNGAENLKGVLAEIDKSARDLMGSNSATYAKGGAAGAGGDSSGAGPALGFLKGPGGPAAPGSTELQFDKKRVPASADGDIWHEGYQGTIFQIVSNKITVVRERVHQLSWASPLNRALAGQGLPATKLLGPKKEPAKKDYGGKKK